jgi:IS5 family transposase
LLARKGHGRAAKLSYAGHVLLDNHYGLVANVCVTAATGTAEREAALLLLTEATHAVTVDGDKSFDVPSFVAAVRAQGATPHLAQKVKHSAIDGRTTRHAAYATSQQRRKLVGQVFGWMKTVGLRKLRHRGGELVDWVVTFAAAADKLIRLRILLARPA